MTTTYYWDDHSYGYKKDPLNQKDYSLPHHDLSTFGVMVVVLDFTTFLNSRHEEATSTCPPPPKESAVGGSNAPLPNPELTSSLRTCLMVQQGAASILREYFWIFFLLSVISNQDFLNSDLLYIFIMCITIFILFTSPWIRQSYVTLVSSFFHVLIL